MATLSLTLQTALAMIFGAVAGVFLGEKAALLGEVSTLFVSLIKALSLPLLFLAINDGFLKSEFKGKGFLALIFVSSFNALCAVTLALFISNTFQPGAWLNLNSTAVSRAVLKADWLMNLGNHFSTHDLRDLLTGTTLVILISLILALALLILRKTFFRTKVSFFNSLSAATTQGLEWVFYLIDRITLLIPVAVFCAVAKTVGVSGFSAAKGLLAYFLACSLGMALHILIVYQSWIRWLGKISLRKFWSVALEPALYAFGINSSLATLPVTLKSLNKLKVSPSSARLSACVGTNFNNDGILLYEVVAALFLIQSYGLQLPLKAQIIVSIISIVACIGVSGIPEAGIISLTIVLSAIGLPSEAIPILLSVDWVLARMRSFTNVLGDITVGIGIDRLTSQGRFSSKVEILK